MKKVEVFAQVIEDHNGDLCLKVLEVNFDKTKIPADECLKYPAVKSRDEKLRQSLAGHDLKSGNTHVIISLDEGDLPAQVSICPTPYYNVTDFSQLLGILEQKFLS